MTDFDMIVYGASGFTGRLVAEYLSKTHPNCNFAMAGRNLSKLADVRDEMALPGDTPLVQADIADQASMDAMAERAKVMITTVGPYLRYGEPLVMACAKAGTDYVDLCGEPPFMWDMIDKYDAMAKTSGARIVHSCGFDSIPFDMGVFLLQAEARKQSGAPIKHVKARVRSYKGQYSGGTAASGAATMEVAGGDPAIMQRLISPFALTPGFAGADQPPGDRPYYDEDLESWVAPFDMAIINTKNIHRSNMLMGHPYGTDFTYEEMIATGPGDDGKAAADKLANMDFAEELKDLKPGDGPDRQTRESGHYELLFTGMSGTGERVSAVVKDNRDPGYGSTCKILSEAALCLIEDVPASSAGVLTPAPVFGDAIVQRLRQHAGMILEIED